MWQHRSRPRAGQQQHAADCRGKGENSCWQTKTIPYCSEPTGGQFGLTHVWTRTEMSPFNVDTPVWGMWTVGLETTSVYLCLWTNMLVCMRAESSPSRPLLAWSGRTLPFSHVFSMPSSANGLEKRAATTEPLWLQPLAINGKFVLVFITTVPMAKCSLGALF